MKLTTLVIIRSLFLFALCIQGISTFAYAAKSNQLKGVRAWPSPDNTRVVLDLSHKPIYETHYLTHPDRLVIDLKSTSTKVNLKAIQNEGPLVKRLRESGSPSKSTYRLVVDLNKASKAAIFTLPPAKPYGHRLVIDLPHNQLNAKKVINNKPKSTIRPQGRDIIVAIDAGHGGDDPGALGKYTQEKKITLQMARRLKSKINRQKGMSAFLVRSGDYFVKLNKRSAIAREGEADFLVSIHADGFTSSRPRGASVWVLSNRRATSEQSRWMENHEAHSELLGGAGEMMQESNLPYFQKMVLDMSMDKSMAVGYKVGDLVAGELKKVTRMHKAKPEHASLAVLKSPDIPSILVEAGFITNRTEEKLLNQAEHQNKITNAVFKGIYKYFTQAPPHDSLFAQKKRAINHTVRSGESLSNLSERYSVSLSALKSYNNLKSTSLQVGQVLHIPPNYQLVVDQKITRNRQAKVKARIHTVKRGESLSIIANKYGTSSATLKTFNKLRSTTLAIGQKINIPGNYAVITKTPKTAKVTLARSHKVKRGESLSVIAAKYNTSSSTLKAYNKLRSTELAIGQNIKIPGTKTSQVSRTQVNKAAPTKVAVTKARSHKVKRGESLSVIAAKYNTSSSTLKAHNNLRSTELAIGQKIKIPASNVTVAKANKAAPAKVTVTKAHSHKVKRGESLSVIAAKYNTSSSALKAHNNLRSTELAIGQKIKIPATNVTVAKVSKATPAKARSQKVRSHKVKNGESLSVIASRYNTNLVNLKAYNKLSSTSLAVGQVIKIPAQGYVATKPVAKYKAQVHKVKSGESLSVIAQRYGTTSQVLKNHNKLSSTSLAVGQRIKIPKQPAKVTKHRVRSGESLSVIASRYGTTMHVIKEYNQLRSSSLAIGQVLTIPIS
jgi:N-acetylmuramoyl-L-alanine amidase